MSLSQEISQAKNLMIWLHEKTNRSKLSHTGKKGLVGIALVQHSLDIADATIILLERDRPGPAWALARPLLESFVRGMWVLHCASDEQVKKLFRGQWPSFLDLLKDMKNNDGLRPNSEWIRANEANVPILHDFTHGGIEHVLRRIAGNVVESAYPEHEIVYLLGLGIEVNIRVGHELIVRMNDVEAIKELFHKASTIRRTQLEKID